MHAYVCMYVRMYMYSCVCCLYEYMLSAAFTGNMALWYFWKSFKGAACEKETQDIFNHNQWSDWKKQLQLCSYKGCPMRCCFFNMIGLPVGDTAQQSDQLATVRYALLQQDRRAGWAGQSGAGAGRAERGRAGRAEQGREEQGRAGGAGRGRLGQSRH